MGGAGEIGVLRGSQRGDQLRLALAEQRREHERQQDRREGELQVDHPHDEGFPAAADIGRADAKRDADDTKASEPAISPICSEMRSP
jgi:hypothetical protein